MIRAVCLIFIFSAITACVGYDSTLFVTKTNYGLDLSTMPPTMALDISRDEGVISPQFEGGKTLPVLASFKASGNNIFSSSLGSTFAAGDAALTLATLYNSRSIGPVSSAAIELDTRPVETRFGSGQTETVDFQSTDVRPVVFGTRTALGLGVGWSTMASAVPDSFNIGYNRKELALIPITQRAVAARSAPNASCATATGAGETDPASYCMDLSSLLATLDFYVDTNSASGAPSPNAKTYYLQYFATGSAASSMATHPAVRMAMLSRLDPDENFQLQGVQAGLPVIFASLMALDRLGQDDAQARALYNAVANKNFSLPASMGAAGLNAYNPPSNAPDTIMLDTASQQQSFSSNTFNDLVAYIKTLSESHEFTKESLEFAKLAKASNTKVIFKDFGAPIDSAVPRDVQDTDLQRIAADLEKLKKALEAQQAALSKDQDVYSAYSYVSMQLTST